MHQERENDGVATERIAEEALSRSHKHVVAFYGTCIGDKGQPKWKRVENRRLRHRNRVRVATGREPLLLLEVSDLWCSPADGRAVVYWNPLPENLKYMRK